MCGALSSRWHNFKMRWSSSNNGRDPCSPSFLWSNRIQMDNFYIHYNYFRCVLKLSPLYLEIKKIVLETKHSIWKLHICTYAHIQKCTYVLLCTRAHMHNAHVHKCTNAYNAHEHICTVAHRYICTYATMHKYVYIVMHLRINYICTIANCAYAHMHAGTNNVCEHMHIYACVHYGNVHVCMCDLLSCNSAFAC